MPGWVNPDNKGELVWYTDGSKTDKGTGTGGLYMGLNKGAQLQSWAPQHSIPG